MRRCGEKSTRKPRGTKIPAGKSFTVESSEEEEESEVESEDESEEASEEESEQGDMEALEDEELPDPAMPSTSSSRTKRSSAAPSAGTGTGTSSKPAKAARHHAPPAAPASRVLLQQEAAKTNVGDYVAANYEGQAFLAQITEDQAGVRKGHTRLSYMTIKGTNQFGWGEKPDVFETDDRDILLDFVIPVPVNSRDHFGFDKDDWARVCRLMVVVYLLLFFQFGAKKFCRSELCTKLPIPVQ